MRNDKYYSGPGFGLFCSILLVVVSIKFSYLCSFLGTYFAGFFCDSVKYLKIES